MERLFIDESGSMTVEFCEQYPYFVIAIVRVKEPEHLKRAFTRFVRKNMDKLKKCHRGKSMFIDGSFKELKGSALSPDLKKKFVEFLCQNNYFEVFYVVAHNELVNSKMYSSTARAFNYLLKLALEYFIKHGYIGGNKLNIQIDERNEKTFSKHFLQDYLNTELLYNDVIREECSVSYFDSSNNKLIQVADVLANLYFSYLMTGNFESEIQGMKENGYIKYVFEFPKRIIGNV